MHSAFMSVFYPITFLNAVQVSKSSRLPVATSIFLSSLLTELHLLWHLFPASLSELRVNVCHGVFSDIRCHAFYVHTETVTRVYVLEVQNKNFSTMTFS